MEIKIQIYMEGTGMSDNLNNENSKKGYGIVNCYKETLPKTRFVGICYNHKDRVNGMFGYLWEKWFKENRFEALEKLVTNEFYGCPRFTTPDEKGEVVLDIGYFVK